MPIDDRVKIKARSIMGTEIPLVQHESQPLALTYGFITPPSPWMRPDTILRR